MSDSSATKIQAVWRGFRYRKSRICKPIWNPKRTIAPLDYGCYLHRGEGLLVHLLTEHLEKIDIILAPEVILKIIKYHRQFKAMKRRREFQEARDEWLKMSTGVGIVGAPMGMSSWPVYKQEVRSMVPLFGIHRNNPTPFDKLSNIEFDGRKRFINWIESNAWACHTLITLKSVNAVSVAVICGAIPDCDEYSQSSWIKNREFVKEDEQCVVNRLSWIKSKAFVNDDEYMMIMMQSGNGFILDHLCETWGFSGGGNTRAQIHYAFKNNDDDDDGVWFNGYYIDYIG